MTVDNGRHGQVEQISGKGLIRVLYDSLRPQQVVNKLTFELADLPYTSNKEKTPKALPAQEEFYLSLKELHISLFEERLKAYLLRPGHPHCAEFPIRGDAVPVDKFDQEKDDPSVRARIFLKAVLAVEMIPLDVSNITVLVFTLYCFLILIFLA